MAKKGKYQTRRRKFPIAVLAALLVIGIGLFIFLKRDTQPQEVLEQPQQVGLSFVLGDLDRKQVQWAQATLYREEHVNLFLREEQIDALVTQLQKLALHTGEAGSVNPTVTVLLHCADREIRILSDGTQLAVELVGAVTENAVVLVDSPELSHLLQPIANLDNVRGWINYLAPEDIENIRIHADTITWDYFDVFAYVQEGNTTITRRFPMKQDLSLVVSGDKSGRPESFILVAEGNPVRQVDVRSGDVKAFLSAYTSSQPVSPQQPAVYSQEQAMIDGFVVMQDGDILHNQANWMNFVELTQAGTDCSITVMHYVHGQQGFTYTRYDITFEEGVYFVNILADERQTTCMYEGLERTEGRFGADQEPYDSYIRYTFVKGTDTGDMVIFEDKIAQPELTGSITMAALILKEGEPELAIYEEPEVLGGLMELVNSAEYMLIPPDDYLFGVKLVFLDEAGNQQILELDIIRGIFRYGQSYYRYGELSMLFEILGLSQWPKPVLDEYGAYLGNA